MNRDDEPHKFVDASEVARLMKQNHPAEDYESSGDEVQDETDMQYWSEDEVAPIEVDSDDE